MLRWTAVSLHSIHRLVFTPETVYAEWQAINFET